jgi:hypothetical protein
VCIACPSPHRQRQYSMHFMSVIRVFGTESRVI